MSVDIRELLDDAAADAPRPDYEHLWNRGRRQGRVRAGAAVVAAVAVVGLAGALLADGLDDRTPAIVDRPDRDGPAPSDVDLPPERFTVDERVAGPSGEWSGPDGILLAELPDATAPGPRTLVRNEKDTAVTALSVLECVTDGGGGSACTYALLDASGDRVLLFDAGADAARLIDLADHGVGNAWSLLVGRVREREVVFVVANRDLAGRGISEALAFDLETRELLARTTAGADVANPRLRLGWADGETAEDIALWVEDGGAWRRLLRAVPDEGNRTRLQLAEDARVDTVWDHVDRADVAPGPEALTVVRESARDTVWQLPSWRVVAAKATFDGALAVLVGTHVDGEPLTMIGHLAKVDRLRGLEVVDPGIERGTDGPLYAFAPDGTMVAVTSTADATRVTAYPPDIYAHASPFTMSGSAQALRLVDRVPWVLVECYVDPTGPWDRPPNGVCVGEGSVQQGGRVALFGADLDARGLPHEDGVRFLADLPGDERPDIVGARWAEVGGPLIHVGIRADGRLFVYELDTGRLRPAVDGEFDSER